MSGKKFKFDDKFLAEEAFFEAPMTIGRANELSRLNSDVCQDSYKVMKYVVKEKNKDYNSLLCLSIINLLLVQSSIELDGKGLEDIVIDPQFPLLQKAWKVELDCQINNKNGVYNTILLKSNSEDLRFMVCHMAFVFRDYFFKNMFSQESFDEILDTLKESTMELSIDKKPFRIPNHVPNKMRY